MHQLDIPMAQSGGPFQMAFHSRSTRLPTAGDRQKDHRQQPESEPIFSLLERKYGVPLIEAEYKLNAVAAENEVVLRKTSAVRKCITASANSRIFCSFAKKMCLGSWSLCEAELPWCHFKSPGG